MKREPLEITSEEFDLLRRLVAMLGHVHPLWDLDQRDRGRAAGVLSRFLNGEGDARFAFIVGPSKADRTKLLEQAVRFLWDAWSEAEGEGQPKGYVFGNPETDAYLASVDEEPLHRRPSAEVQAAIRNVLETVPQFKVRTGDS